MWNNRIAVLLGFLLVQSNVWAKDMEVNAGISTSLDYSDNINLDATNEKDDFVLRVTPSISFKKDGARVKSNLNYSITGLLHASETDDNEIQHRLFSAAESEIIKNSLFLDVDASISQELLNPNSYSDGISGSQNLTQTYTYGVSPYWRKKWGKYAESILRYDYNELKYDGSNSGEDSTGENINLDVSSGREFDLITWNINYDHNEISYDKSDTTTSEIIKLVLGYHYSNQLELRFTTGYEDYDSPQDTQNNPNGNGWAVGFIWTPSTRNTLDLNIGNRFYGTAYRLDYKHRGKRINWNVSYNEDVTSQRGEIRENNQDREENPDNITPPIGTNNDEGELYLSRKGRSDLSYSYGKSTITWGMYHERRYYSDADNKDEDNYGTDLSWGWRIGKRTTMITSLSWSVYDDVTAGDKQTRTGLDLSLNRRMTPDTSAYLRLSYQDNDADTKINEYTENRISLGLTKQF